MSYSSSMGLINRFNRKNVSSGTFPENNRRTGKQRLSCKLFSSSDWRRARMNSMIGYWRRNRIIYCSTNVLIMRIPSEKWTKKCISRKNEVNNKNVETLFLQVSVTNEEDNRLEKRKCLRPWDEVDNFILQQPNWSKWLTHKDFINHDATMRLQIRDIIIFCQI